MYQSHVLIACQGGAGQQQQSLHLHHPSNPRSLPRQHLEVPGGENRGALCRLLRLWLWHGDQVGEMGK